MTEEASPRIGILGGSFDPPHVAHLALAEAAIQELELDEVVLMPNRRNPLKQGKPPVPGSHRLAMLRLLIAGRPGLAVSDVEISRAGPSYTVDTLEDLQRVRPASYWFLMGSDAVKTLPQWKQPQRLVRLCRLGIALRPPQTRAEVEGQLGEFRDVADFFGMPPSLASSTELRLRLNEGRSTLGMIPDDVLQYIQAHELYQNA